MLGRDRELAIVDELFFEQEHEALWIGYKHGLLRAVFGVCRSVLFARSAQPRVADALLADTAVAVVFFENELRALARRPQSVPIDRIVKLELRSLPVIREQLGLGAVFVESLRFARFVIRRKGICYLRRSGIPLLGWLLYRAFAKLLAGKPNVTVITTNMVHPTSIAVHWAAVGAAQPTAFYEHATTPELIMKNRGYGCVYVNFEHTRELMVARGFAPETVRLLRPVEPVARAVALEPIRHAAICINSYDSLQSVLDMVAALRTHGLQIRCRVHDADPRIRDIRRLALDGSMSISLATESMIESFLGTVDMVVTGNSNVIADALRVGKPVLYYWAGQEEMFDYYGFVRCYAIQCASTQQSLEARIGELIGRVPVC